MGKTEIPEDRHLGRGTGSQECSSAAQILLLWALTELCYLRQVSCRDEKTIHSRDGDQESTMTYLVPRIF